MLTLRHSLLLVYFVLSAAFVLAGCAGEPAANTSEAVGMNWEGRVSVSDSSLLSEGRPVWRLGN